MKQPINPANHFAMLLMALAMAFTFLACEEKDKGAETGGTFTDARDGKIYKTVKIGDQVWMAENLAFGCANCGKYGSSYNWEGAMKACPSGWHLPSDAEWEALVAFAGGENVAGKKLKSKSGWDGVCYNAEGGEECNPKGSNGTDEFGFSAMPSGGYFGDGGRRPIGNGGFWWSSTKKTHSLTNSLFMQIENGSNARRGEEGDYCIFSVRCIQNTTAPQTATPPPPANYSPALQTHFPKGILGEADKTRPVEMFFQKVLKNGETYVIVGKSKTKAAEDAFSGTLSISSQTAGGPCGSGETELKGSYDLNEKASKTSGHFAGSFTACEKSGTLSKASFKGHWIKHSNGSKTPCEFGISEQAVAKEASQAAKGCPSKTGPLQTAEATFLKDDTGYESRAVFRLANGSEINLVTDYLSSEDYTKVNGLKKGDKVSITYKEIQRLDEEPNVEVRNCLKDKHLVSLKKLPNK
jgi:uncharacterized protein (TIGR02145 family)